MSLYGPMVTGAHVEAAAIETMQLWMPGYLAEAERQAGLDARSLATPRAWKTTNEDIDHWPELQLPAVVIVSPGIVERPTKDGAGRYTAVFGLAIGVVVNARDQAAANLNAKLYGACVVAMLLHHPSLGGFASALDWVDLSYDDVPADYLSVGAYAAAGFEVTVPDVLHAYSGPTEPPDDPYEDPGDRPTVATTDLTLTAEALT